MRSTQIPLFTPETEWVMPEELKDLRGAKEIAIDLETRDPDLKSKGSGSVIGNGEIVGIAVAVPGRKFYFPIAHGAGPNMNKKKTLEWFKDILLSDAIKIFHNAIYDVLWIYRLGLTVHGTVVDTMVIASLVDENRFRYDLNSVATDYVGIGKNENALQEAAKEWGVDAKNDMWRLPPMYVGPYAEQDAELALKLFDVFMLSLIHI